MVIGNKKELHLNKILHIIYFLYFSYVLFILSLTVIDKLFKYNNMMLKALVMIMDNKYKIFIFFGILSVGNSSLFNNAPMIDTILLDNNNILQHKKGLKSDFNTNNNNINFISCPIGYFECNSTRKCVAQHLICNGEADCDDGSDEWNCNDEISTIFWDSLFRKQPYARSDNIPIGSCYWSNFNTTCDCRSKEILCRFKNFTKIQENFPDDTIEMLDLTGNNFPVLTKNIFIFLPQIEILVLKFCSISVIEPFAFDVFSKKILETIYLDQNKIESLPDNLFSAHNLIKILILSFNKINVLHSYNFKNLENLVELDLSNNLIESFSQDVFYPLNSLKILYLNGNKIKEILPGMFPKLFNLKTLVLSHNQIKNIEKQSFYFQNLDHLFLSSNRISQIRDDVFCGVPGLKGLNLDGNEINEFGDDSFKCAENLTSLDLTGNMFKTLDRKILRNLTNLNHIYFSWFHLCNTVLHVRDCEPKGDGISSAYHLLDNTVLRGSVWIMAGIGIIGNSIVLLGHLCNKSRSHVDHSIYLRNLAASDLLMGIYLAIIAIADIKYRGKYLLHEEIWRHSFVCSFSGFLSTLSCQSSTLLLTLITWDRLISVIKPLQPRTTSKTMVFLRLLALWGASILAAAAPFSYTNYFGEYFYGNNGVCLSLHIHDPYAKGWEYSASLFIVINTFSLIFICISYLRMLHAIRGSGEAMRSTLSGRENIVARRFAVIVATDCICWLPIILVKLVALGGVQIPASLYAWLAVLVLPVNSALNPVLYTLTTASFRQQVRRYFHAHPWSLYGSTRQSRSQTACDSGFSLSLGQYQNGSSRKRMSQRKISFV